tara:strand:- start:1864 stop:2259 length:396 start_codon:yes stop_codon:yes gene_type:complete
MVLYYNIKRPDNDSQEAVENIPETSHVIQTPSPAARIIPMQPTIKDENLADRLSTLIAGGHPEFSSKIESLILHEMDKRFKDLSLDDKLFVMHRTSILRNNITNKYISNTDNYILLCLALLVIITVKVFSK